MIIKHIMKSTLLFALLFISTTAFAQKPIETQFEVSGVCGMCEDRIESALDVKGIKMADYDLDSHQLSLVYNPKHISEEEIHQLLNAAGHDTEKSKASDAQYDTVHDCCKYREDGNH